MSQSTVDIAHNPEEITAALEAVFEGPIENLVRLSGGASQEIWSFDAPDFTKSPGLILRRGPSGIEKQGPTALATRTEAGLIAAADAVGVPVPAVVRICEPGDGLGHGFIMSRLEGETIPRKILRDEDYEKARSQLAFQCGRALAGIHRIDVTAVTGLPLLPAPLETDHYFAIYDGFDDRHPVFELAFRWLRDNMPRDLAPSVVHGDFRNGNLIVGPEGLRAVLDWELAHLGDPMEDLAWICVNSWRFGQVHNPVGGFGAREDLFAGYEAGGGKPDPARVHFWEVLGTLKWGVMCIIMVTAFRTGMDRSVERAAIGRRASETEIDLLNLLAGDL
jgi:aminoglycoside phosphotransferase (APT) family kinase protein